MSAVPFIPFTNCARLEAIFLADYQQVENVHMFEFEGSPSQADMIDIAQLYVLFWTANLRDDVGPNVALNKVIVTDLSHEHSPSIEYTTGLPLYGTAETTPLPNNCTMAVKWTTGLRGRSYRGRTYHVGLTESDSVGSIIPASQITAYKDAYETLITLGTELSNPCHLVIGSRMANKEWRTSGVTTPVTGCSINNVIDSQRRRLPERGR